MHDQGEEDTEEEDTEEDEDDDEGESCVEMRDCGKYVFVFFVQNSIK